MEIDFHNVYYALTGAFIAVSLLVGLVLAARGGAAKQLDHEREVAQDLIGNLEKRLDLVEDQLRDESAQSARLLARLDALQHENRELKGLNLRLQRMNGRQRARIVELESRVAAIERAR